MPSIMLGMGDTQVTAVPPQLSRSSLSGGGDKQGCPARVMQ